MLPGGTLFISLHGLCRQMSPGLDFPCKADHAQDLATAAEELDHLLPTDQIDHRTYVYPTVGVN